MPLVSSRYQKEGLRRKDAHAMLYVDLAVARVSKPLVGEGGKEPFRGCTCTVFCSKSMSLLPAL